MKDQVAHLVFSHRGERRRTQSQPGGPDGDIGGTPPHHRLESGHLLKRRPDLPGVQVQIDPANGDQVDEVWIGRVAGWFEGGHADPENTFFILS